MIDLRRGAAVFGTGIYVVIGKRFQVSGFSAAAGQTNDRSNLKLKTIVHRRTRRERKERKLK